jgi:hypothetical protein
VFHHRQSITKILRFKNSQKFNISLLQLNRKKMSWSLPLVKSQRKLRKRRKYQKKRSLDKVLWDQACKEMKVWKILNLRVSRSLEASWILLQKERKWKLKAQTSAIYFSMRTKFTKLNNLYKTKILLKLWQIKIIFKILGKWLIPNNLQNKKPKHKVLTWI